MNPNPRKRSIGQVGFTSTPTKRAKVALQGPAFTTGIANITGSGSPHVYTQVRIPMEYGSAAPRSFDLQLDATFSAIDHNSSTDPTAWTQGYMQMGGDTSYEKILPANLGVRQATVESRVMKRLALGPAYTPKTTSFHGEQTTQQGMRAATKNWGRPAVQSYLEDITGRTSLNLQEVGSGMRALVLASKLRMRTTGAASEGGFATKMTGAFPQLLTGTSTPPGGAAHYNAIIHQQLLATPGASGTQANLWSQVRTAHREVNRESRNRFNYKWAQIEAGNMTTTQAGRWWAAKFGAGVTGAGTLTGTGVRKRVHRRAYVRNKLGRHDITHFR